MEYDKLESVFLGQIFIIIIICREPAKLPKIKKKEKKRKEGDVKQKRKIAEINE